MGTTIDSLQCTLERKKMLWVKMWTMKGVGNNKRCTREWISSCSVIAEPHQYATSIIYCNNQIHDKVYSSRAIYSAEAAPFHRHSHCLYTSILYQRYQSGLSCCLQYKGLRRLTLKMKFDGVRCSTARLVISCRKWLRLRSLTRQSSLAAPIPLSQFSTFSHSKAILLS